MNIIFCNFFINNFIKTNSKFEIIKSFYLFNLFFLLLLSNISLYSEDIEIVSKINIFEELIIDQTYIIRLRNGDEITGIVSEKFTNDNDEYAIKFKTELGKTTIYDYQVADIRKKEDFYRHTHRVFLLPTAEPIGKNPFVGNFELLLFYGGVGVSDWLSITAGTTIVPTIRRDEQFSTMNVKLTVYDEKFDSMEGKASIAVGGNLAFINHNNNFQHLYAVASFTGYKSIITGGFFFKLGNQNNYEIKFGREFLNMNYLNGSMGVGIGLDSKFSNWNDIHFIGELWNSDIASPTNTAVLLGLRLANTKFSADFGLAFFTQPFAVPVFSFTWTPF